MLNLKLDIGRLPGSMLESISNLPSEELKSSDMAVIGQFVWLPSESTGMHITLPTLSSFAKANSPSVPPQGLVP